MCNDKREALAFILSSFSLNMVANICLYFTNPIYASLPVTYCTLMAFTYIFSFAFPTYKFYRNPNIPNAKLLKGSSYIHLSVFFLIIIVDTCLRIYENKCKKGLENAETSKKIDE